MKNKSGKIKTDFHTLALNNGDYRLETRLTNRLLSAKREK